MKQIVPFEMASGAVVTGSDGAPFAPSLTGKNETGPAQ